MATLDTDRGPARILLDRYTASVAASMDALTATRAGNLDNLSNLDTQIGCTQFQSSQENNASGISVPKGANFNTEGAWTEIIATTSFRAYALNLAINGGVWLDVGVGASGSEVAIINDIFVSNLVTYFGPYRVDIPSGSRIAVRARSYGSIVVHKMIIGG